MRGDRQVGGGRGVRARLARAGGLLVLAGAAVGALALTHRAGAVDTACQASGPPSNAYTMTVCLTAPAAGAALDGDQVVTATVSISGPTPGVQRMVFTLDGAYLLTAFAPDPGSKPASYTFSLHTKRFADGPHTIAASVSARDGFVSSPAAEVVNFNNGQRVPPKNTNTFTPTAGTAPAAGKPLVVAAVGDGAGGEPAETSVVDLIAGWNPNLFLYLGDVYEKGSPAEYDNWYGPAGDAAHYGRFKSITDPTIGNHEYTGTSAPGYFDYWDNVPHWYSFDAGGWHFVSLDSNTKFSPLTPDTEQYQWLANDLAQSRDKCTIAFFHHPLWDIGAEGATPALKDIWSLLARDGVDIVLNGHDHTYQRWKPLDADGVPSATGTTEFVAGTGGHALQTITGSDPRVVASSDKQSGALRLELGPDSASFSFVAVGGTTLDSGVVPCSPVVGSFVVPPPPGTTTTTTGPSVPPATTLPGTVPTVPPASTGETVPTVPTGPTGATTGAGIVPPPPVAPALKARLTVRALGARAGAKLTVRYTASRAARATLALIGGRGRPVVLLRRAAKGRNAIVLRAPRLTGRYQLVLSLRAAGHTVVDRGRLSVLPPRRR